jgi:hypothetical protein
MAGFASLNPPYDAVGSNQLRSPLPTELRGGAL